MANDADYSAGQVKCLDFIEKNRIIIIRNHIEVLMLTHGHIHTQSHTHTYAHHFSKDPICIKFLLLL